MNKSKVKSSSKKTRKSPARKSKIKSRSKSRSKSKHKKPVKQRNDINLFKQRDGHKDKLYLDINATTPMCKAALNAISAWVDHGNPSSSSNAGMEAKKLITHAIAEICKHCSISPKKYKVLFTPSATAANNQILKSTAIAYKNMTQNTPHIITSSIEHKSLLRCAKALENNKDIELTVIDPDIYGRIDPRLIEAAIKPNTALISIMAVNNEMGSKNDIKTIGEISAKRNVAFHSDVVQLFGKERIPMAKLNIDAISVSFHKFYGPKGIGLLIMSNDLITGYGLDKCPLIFGSQQGGLLGGTENVSLIASGVAALKSTFNQRTDKNKKITQIMTTLIDGLSQHLPFGNIHNYITGLPYDETKEDAIFPMNNYEFVIIGPPFKQKNHRVTNTLLISIVNNKSTFCNIKLKKCLLDKNIIISIGSACNTDNKSASHVLNAIKAPDVIKSGIIRISIGDFTTARDISQFVSEFIQCIGKQIPHILAPRQKPRQSKPRIKKNKSKKKS